MLVARKHSPGCLCCGAACPLELEDLPTVAISDWTADAWTLTDSCCAYTFLYPNVCIPPTFEDGGDIDSNTRTTAIEYNSMAVLYNNDVLEGTQTDPPDRLCPPCQEPFICRSNYSNKYLKIATRYGILYAPWRVLVRICYVEVQCGEDPPAMKYVLESRFDYKILAMFQKYSHLTSSSGYTSSGCCTGSSSFSDSPAAPDTTDPDFWGYTSVFPDCLSEYTSTVSFSRYKIYDNIADIPAGSLAFSAVGDCPNCLVGGVALSCDETEFCIETTGTSDPSIGSLTIDCTPDPVLSIDCNIKWLHPCNSLWYYVDPDTETIACSPFAPFPRFPDTICGPVTYTVKGQDAECLSEFGVGFSNVSSACLSEPTPPCVGSWVRFASGWVDYTLYTITTVCSGGTTAEICIPAPSWTVGIAF